MKRSEQIRPNGPDDAALDWMMRIIGIFVFAASAFFIYKDISLNPAYDYFFAMTALLGFVTAAASWLRPEYENNHWSRESRPQLRPVRESS